MRTRNRPSVSSSVDETVRQIKECSEQPPEITESIVGPDPKTITKDRLVPSGVTILNCACSDNYEGAFAMGSINTIPGESASGKTELMLSMLASCALDSRFGGHELILDDAEHAMSFDLEYLFPPLAGRLKAPNYDGENPVYSHTIEDFEGSLLLLGGKPKSNKEDKKGVEQKQTKRKKSFIYVLDSLDSLSSTAELEREYKNALKTAKSDEAVKELKKSYGTEKARILGQVLRMVNGNIKNTDSALFIIQQTRQVIADRGIIFGPKWITSGGEAPYFYSFHRVYLSCGRALTETSKNIKHQIGGHTYCQVIKNKLNGKKRKSGVEFDIFEDIGIDDVGSCVDFLKMTDVWQSDAGGITAPEILGNNQKMHRMDLIRHIEKENAIPELQKLVGKVWNEIEDDIRLKDRKRRF